MSNKIFLIILSFLTAMFFSFVLRFGGDVEYFIYENDSSWRNGLMSFIIRPLYGFTGSVQLLAVVWAILFCLMLNSLRRKLTFSHLLYVFMFSPFLLFPSKESIVAFFAILWTGAAISYKYRNYLYFPVIFILRPFFLPTLAFSLLLSSTSRIILLAVTAGACCLALPFLPSLMAMWPIYLESYFSYAHGYFASAQYAGTTDWIFVNEAKFFPISWTTFLHFASRSLIPFWMLGLGSISAYFYFFLYCFSMVTAFIWSRNALSKGGFRRPSAAAALIVVIAVLAASPLLISNAGSAVRYISVLPFVALIASSIPAVSRVQTRSEPECDGGGEAYG